MQTQESIKLAQVPPFALGAVAVEPAARTLRARDLAIELEPRTMQVLVALAHLPGAVVGRQTLIDRCWEGRIVADDAINRAILKLRRGMTEAGVSATIETIPRIGYRLVLQETEPVGTIARYDRRRVSAIGAAALTLGVASFGLVRLRRPAPVTDFGMSERAREMFERGEAAFQQGSRDDNAQAIGFFVQAAKLAPTNSRIAGALALALRFEQTFRGPEMLEQSTRRADAATGHALALDPHDPDAIAARSLHLPFGTQWLEVERGLRSGLREVPDSGVMNGFLGMLLANVGRNQAAIVAFEHAMKQARFVPLLRGFLIQALLADGQTHEADRELDAAIALWPRYANLWWLRFWTYVETARFDLARIHATPTPGLPIGIGTAQIDAANLAITAIETRTGPSIRAALEAWKRIAIIDRILRTAAINLTAMLGQIDEAFATLNVAMAPYLTANGAGAPTPAFLFGKTLAPMRKDPRFSRLCDEIGLAAYWRESGSHPDTRLSR